MGKKLIITEKPSVAQDFAKVFQVSGRNNGYIENQEYVITWCVGHLVEMVYPEEYDSRYKKWMLEDLPFLPQQYKYGVIQSVKQQYDIVHRLLHREDIDTVYWAGDSGKEGQTIEENIRNFGGVREGMTELRVWIDSQTEEEIRRGVAEARPMSDYANLGASGIMRSIEDYAMGINFSRVMSVKYGRLLNEAAATQSYTAIAIGRVMTCVLGMVVNREREIRNFKETSYYRIAGDFTDAHIEAEWRAAEGSAYFESPKLYRENGFRERTDAEALIASLAGKPAVVKTLEKGTAKKKAPLLFNLAELQAECAKRFKISPDETLQAAQDLYEKKLTTYPRTDARVLTTAVAKEIEKNIRRLQGYEPTGRYVEEILQKKAYAKLAKTAYTDDGKVTDHYAIIPTGQLTELRGLTPLQRRVFELIVRRFLSIFYPPAEYQTLKLVVGVEKESLFSSAKVLKTLGYLEVMGKTLEDADTEENEAPKDGGGQEQAAEDEGIPKDRRRNAARLLELSETLKAGDSLTVNGYEMKDSKTSPPKRYTSGSMILAMENAGQLIEDEELRAQIKGSGIGTSATRAEIIKKLIRIGYLNLNKKTQMITPERFGEMVYEVVAMTVPALLNPQMTASWEKGLDGITNGTIDVAVYRGKLEDFIRRETLQIREQDLTGRIAEQISQFSGKGAKGLGARKRLAAKCPDCGGDIVTTPFGYGCANYQKDGSGCRFAIGKIAEKELSAEQAEELLTAGRTATIRGFKGKSGKRFDACLVLAKNENDKHVIKFDFEHVEAKKVKDAVCPLCGGEIVRTPFGYGCANYDREDEKSCRFSIGKLAGKELSETQVKALLANGRTDIIRGFKAKTGKKFDAHVILNKDAAGTVTGLKFEFPDRPEPQETALQCPRCKALKLRKSQWYYECTCGFRVGHTVARVGLSEEQMRELFEEGRTRERVSGFVSKAGSSFDAYLKYGEEKISFDFDNQEQRAGSGGEAQPWLSPEAERTLDELRMAMADVGENDNEKG
ncbi:MAG: DNA topoisomerase [Roseburia sp.]|nr:DNA topoisomerase [Roseburia sp.]